MSTTTTTVEGRNLAVYLSVENVEDRVHRGRAYAPSSATIRYSAFVVSDGEIGGPIRKKDGALGITWVTEPWRYESAPEWLKAVIDAERPEWARR